MLLARGTKGSEYPTAIGGSRSDKGDCKYDMLNIRKDMEELIYINH